MTDQDRKPVQANGAAGDAATPDGVNDPEGGGESGGGAYPNPHGEQDAGRFGGGQSGKDYHGGPGGALNAAAGTDTSDAT